MSRTKKDLKSHKKGFGRYRHKPQRKLTPLSHDANKIAGKNEVLFLPPENDISQDDYMKTHWHNGKSVRAIRKHIRTARNYMTSRARTKIKQHDKKDIESLL